MINNTTSIRKGVIDDVILKLIWDKTGIMFIKPEYGVHNIISNNLREIAVLVNMLQDMDDPKDDSTVLIKNINQFKDMFINSWIMSNLSEMYVKIIQQFLEINLEYKNQYIVKSIYSLLPDGYKNRMKRPGKVQNLDNMENVKPYDNRIFEILASEVSNPLNINIGDVIFALKIYKQYGPHREAEQFIFSIKTLYTIYLTQLIKIECDFDKARVLIGGNIYNIDYKNILPRREDCRFNGELTDEYRFSLKNNSSVPKIQIIEWLSYFVLNIGTETNLTPVNILNEGFEQYRIGRDTYYSYSFDSFIEKSFTLNILAFVTNLLQPRQDFEERFGNDLCLFKSICEWHTKYYSIIPIYSLEFIEQFTDNFIFSYKKTKSNGVDSFELIIKSIYNLIKEIFEKNKLIYSDSEINKFLKAVENCPLTSCFFNGERYNIVLSKQDLEDIWYPPVDEDDKSVSKGGTNKTSSNKIEIDKLDTQKQNDLEKEKKYITKTDINALNKSLAYFEIVSKSGSSTDDIAIKINEVIKIFQKYKNTTDYVKLCEQIREKLNIEESNNESKDINLRKISFEMSDLLKDLLKNVQILVKRKIKKKSSTTGVES